MSLLEIQRDSQGELTIQLTEQEGDSLRDLIESRTFMNMPNYSHAVGIKASNLYAILKGQRVVSTKLLNKVLSGVQCEITCKIQIQVRELATGAPAQDVDFTQIEAELLLGQTLQEENISTSCSSEKLQEEQKTDLESPSVETPNESSSETAVSLNSLRALLKQNIAGPLLISSVADQKKTDSQ